MTDEVIYVDEANVLESPMTLIEELKEVCSGFHFSRNRLWCDACLYSALLGESIEERRGRRSLLQPRHRRPLRYAITELRERDRPRAQC
jgi:hypothetical protein